MSLFSTTTGIILVWEQLTPVSNVTYEYEVAYSIDPVCSGDHVSLPDGYTLNYPRTSNDYIEVAGLISGTCYVFGVRAYTSVTDYPGEFSLIQGNTTSHEGCNYSLLILVDLGYPHSRHMFISYPILYRLSCWNCRIEYDHCYTDSFTNSAINSDCIHENVS